MLSSFGMDRCWYRARVLNVDRGVKPTKVEVFYIDYGNTETVSIDKYVCHLLPNIFLPCFIFHVMVLCKSLLLSAFC